MCTFIAALIIWDERLLMSMFCFMPASLESTETRSGFLSGRRPTETCYLCALCDSARDNCFSPSLSRESGLPSRAQRRGGGFFLGEGPPKHVISVLSATLREIIVSRPLRSRAQRRGVGFFLGEGPPKHVISVLSATLREIIVSRPLRSRAQRRGVGFFLGEGPPKHVISVLSATLREIIVSRPLRSRAQRRGVGFFLGEGPPKHVISVLSATLRETFFSRPVYPENRDFARGRRDAEWVLFLRGKSNDIGFSDIGRNDFLDYRSGCSTLNI